MNKRIPIRVVKDIAREFKLDQVIMVAYERDAKKEEHMTHVVTYGKTKVDCLQAAQGGNVVKKALGWPDSLRAEPTRIEQVKEDAQEKLISDIWGVATEDDEMNIFEHLLIEAGYRWRCKNCNETNFKKNTECSACNTKRSK